LPALLAGAADRSFVADRAGTKNVSRPDPLLHSRPRRLRCAERLEPPTRHLSRTDLTVPHAA
jgi:hypothetical protein